MEFELVPIERFPPVFFEMNCDTQKRWNVADLPWLQLGLHIELQIAVHSDMQFALTE